ncbi:bifunctional UDP-N-acetylglucosamine diphosphorylase/glucosamine-1-phosphate N-acetyltransferase GlmU [Chelatococcus daeguensis]|uniref:Bifunctional protein GlmU n=2 Tax=Chelatococcus TaxID=28209 RepID=A0AAC9NYX7_9HYPH|nr:MULTISPECIES: bifunctional UDP-N-acetylglucosamine diphosphorylase/glucosamine-1-phosphate N-acetyltransferase GlmU [Chelatococcus]APF37583.1 UDP-N-acetylglucosamine diphosphorylase/glucosamine-1-phosphate N-acetyltransferase [Chelatococcus daeguensis]KZE35519.1 bifunctional N-acetylglucosamine-1-phosphate uridyltransferase/glucosamine-1-phosphate acetyltransferase [Chelatococcus daeguensis]MBM3085523.1 bifunctional UDP-N-acetylglucosamine diphosphorylase/glucosamine-1-phosphate N-acetyltrans
MVKASDPAAARRCLVIVLAAGEGTRMKSRTPKVLHALAGRSLLAHVLHAVSAAGADAVSVVVGPDRDDVAAEARRVRADATIHVQAQRLGTAHAVLAARDEIAQGYDDVLVAFADTPLVTAETFGRLRAELARGAAVAVLGFEAADPNGYGRLIIEGEDLLAIREHKDANDEERRVGLCNAGLMALDGGEALALLDAIGQDNAQREFYLTDAVAVARARGLKAHVVVADEAEVQGINDRTQLAQAEATLQVRLRLAAMREGATLQAPETVFLSADTRLGRDVVVEPHVVFGPGAMVEDGAVIHAFSHLEGARVRAGASVGPYARLRPGTDIGEGARVGNFVEVKNATLGAGAKANHLSYLGDATIGARANIGAGTITCNYDGFRKHRTEVGAGAFVGSNSSLVAPVTIGDGAFVGSGSVVTMDVPADALAVGRARQVTKDGWAQKFRETFSGASTKKTE